LEAEKNYRRALAIAPQDRYSRMGLADLYQKNGRPAEALSHYRKLIELGVELVNILTITAQLCSQLGEHEEARRFYERVLAKESDNPYALYGLGDYHRWRQDYRQAIVVWERILEKGKGTINMRSRLGDAHRKLGNFTEAEGYYEGILAERHDRYALAGLIKLRCLQGEIAAATAGYEEYRRREGDDWQFLADLEHLLDEAGHRERMRDFYRRSLALLAPQEPLRGLLQERLAALEETP
jgi:tetratricopeptide (TPR) repeat protein